MPNASMERSSDSSSSAIPEHVREAKGAAPAVSVFARDVPQSPETRTNPLTGEPEKETRKGAHYAAGGVYDETTATARTMATRSGRGNALVGKQKKDARTSRLLSDDDERSTDSFSSQWSLSSPDTETGKNARRDRFPAFDMSSRRNPPVTELLSHSMLRRRFPSSSRGAASDPTAAASAAVFLSVCVFGLSPLHADPSVVHPFVRLSLLSGTTGESLVAPADGRAPVALTNPLDLRLRRTRAPSWDAELSLRVRPAAMERAANAVLLLEVLDTCSECLHGYQLRRGGLYPICWGFVKMWDAYGRPNLNERMHVEMFPFPQRASLFTRALQCILPFALSSEAVWAEAETPSPPPLLQVSPEREAQEFSSAVAIPSPSSLTGDQEATRAAATGFRPPDIFYIYRDARNRKVPYGAGLTISLKAVKDELYVPRKTLILPYEEYLFNELTLETGEPLCRDFFTSSASVPSKGRTSNMIYTFMNADALGSSYLRKPSERVVPPTQIIQHMQIKGRVTCAVFSPNNGHMAMGVTADYQHVIQLRNSLEEEMRLLGIGRGHLGHIHHVAFASDARLLLSCSSDKTVRVWQLDHPDLGVGKNVHMQLYCLSTLPHDFPIYCAIFYKGHIITCGFDPRMFVWCYEGKQSDKSTESDSILSEAYHCKSRGATPSDSTRPVEVQISVDTADPFPGEIVSVTAANNKSAIYAICAAEPNRVWSVDTAGNVVIWRASREHTRDGTRHFQLSPRHRFECPGATRVEVCGSRAFATCAQAAVVYLFDVATSQLAARVLLHQRPYLPAVALLPDGEAFLAATRDGKLLCWAGAAGALCTPREGFAGAQVHFAAARIAWAKSQQLAALVGSEGSSGLTPVAIIGTPREEKGIIRLSNPKAADIFQSLFGGGPTTTQRLKHSSFTDKKQRFTMVKTTAEGECEGVVETRETPFTDKKSRMGQIISLWKGLVGQHNREKGER